MEELTQRLDDLLKGKSPQRLNVEEIADASTQELANRVNQLIDRLAEIREFILPLSGGDLRDIKISPSNLMASPFKALHASLKHLTWQAGQVAHGDYSQRVDFMGEFSEAFNAMVIALDRNERLLKDKIQELEAALGRIDTLEGILPICAHCKKIRPAGAEATDQKSWVPVERYVEDRSKAQFSHGLCPECLEKYYAEEEV